MVMLLTQTLQKIQQMEDCLYAATQFSPVNPKFVVHAFPFLCCRFYVENITQLKDIITVELFFLNAKSAVYNVSVFLHYLFFLWF